MEKLSELLPKVMEYCDLHRKIMVSYWYQQLKHQTTFTVGQKLHKLLTQTM